jgi:hypothetical protein
MRTTKEVRERLEQAAAESGRSLVQEVERRIENSFQYDSVLNTFGGKNSIGILRPIVFFLGSLEMKGMDYRWKENPAVADELRRALAFILEAALSGEPLSRERQVEALGPFSLNETGKVVHGQGEAAIITEAVVTARALGLVDSLEGLPRRQKSSVATAVR